jgi:hypothetical protein
VESGAKDTWAVSGDFATVACCSDLLIKEILLRTKDLSLLHSDTQRTTEERFRRLHTILLGYFVLRFHPNYPTLSEDLRDALVDVVDERILAHDVFDFSAEERIEAKFRSGAGLLR